MSPKRSRLTSLALPISPEATITGRAGRTPWIHLNKPKPSISPDCTESARVAWCEPSKSRSVLCSPFGKCLFGGGPERGGYYLVVARRWWGELSRGPAHVIVARNGVETGIDRQLDE